MKKIKNEYVALIDADVFEKCPKSVLAAIVISGSLNLDNHDVTDFLLSEWQILYENKIVSQKPVKRTKVSFDEFFKENYEEYLIISGQKNNRIQL